MIFFFHMRRIMIRYQFGIRSKLLFRTFRNSAEMDFDISGDGVIDLSGIWLHNWNTDKEYLLTHKDVEDFYDGQPITLFGV